MFSLSIFHFVVLLVCLSSICAQNPNNTVNDPTKTPTSNSNSSDPITTDRTGRIWVTQPQLSSASSVRIRVGDKFNIAWKYDDSVQKKPENITLALSVDRKNWVPIVTLPGAPTKYTWNTSDWDTINKGPLLVSTTYTIAIYDERGVDADPLIGSAMANLDIKFQFYDSGDNFCAACSSARKDHPAFWALLLGVIVKIIYF